MATDLGGPAAPRRQAPPRISWEAVAAAQQLARGDRRRRPRRSCSAAASARWPARSAASALGRGARRRSCRRSPTTRRAPTSARSPPAIAAERARLRRLPAHLPVGRLHGAPGAGDGAGARARGDRASRAAPDGWSGRGRSSTASCRRGVRVKGERHGAGLGAVGRLPGRLAASRASAPVESLGGRRSPAVEPDREILGIEEVGGDTVDLTKAHDHRRRRPRRRRRRQDGRRSRSSRRRSAPRSAPAGR